MFHMNMTARILLIPSTLYDKCMQYIGLKQYAVQKMMYQYYEIFLS